MHTKLEFNSTINPSVQVGDEVYFCTPSLDGVTASEPVHVAQVYSISPEENHIVINKAPTEPPISLYFVNGDPPPLVVFAKHVGTNESSLKGYFADVTFENKSNSKCELFGFGSEISLSSK